VLPGHELAEAVAVAECIRDAVQKIELPPGMGSRLSQGMSVSIGVAASGRGAGTAGAVELLLQQADRQLYEAKNAGRNVVMPGEVRPSATHPSSPSLPTRQAG
jgi:diguanylate cyclase (GGDEF)-like protein